MITLRAGALSVVLLAAGGPAGAHAILVDSVPAPNGTLPAGHDALHLRYNSRIDRERSRISLTAPDRTVAVLQVQPDGPPNVLDSAAELTPGGYTLRWQVLAVDGHITRGTVPFTVVPKPAN